MRRVVRQLPGAGDGDVEGRQERREVPQGEPGLGVGMTGGEERRVSGSRELRVQHAPERPAMQAQGGGDQRETPEIMAEENHRGPGARELPPGQRIERRTLGGQYLNSIAEGEVLLGRRESGR